MGDPSAGKRKKMDDILNAALDDLDSDSDEGEQDQYMANGDSGASVMRNLSEQAFKGVPSSSFPGESEERMKEELDQLNHMMRDIMSAAGESEETVMGHILDQLNVHLETMQQTASESQQSAADAEEKTRRRKIRQKTDTGNEENASLLQDQSPSKSEVSSPSGRVPFGPPPPPPRPPEVQENVDKAISNLLDDMASEKGDPTNVEELDEMIQQLAEMGEGAQNFNPDELMDGMMSQLMAKELMYEPMKQVNERFPSWLQENKHKLSDEEYQDRCKQHECFKTLIHVYETDPENTERLVELMTQVQEYGQPPADIVREIAPDLELDENGEPDLTNLFGGGGLPNKNDCQIM